MRLPVSNASVPLVLLLAGILAGTVPAQEPVFGQGPTPSAVPSASPGDALAEPPTPPPITGLGRVVGPQLHDGAVLGGGRTYMARFDDRGIEFTPAFGRAAPHNTPLRFSLAEVRRDGASLPVAADVAPAPDSASRRVDYDRGAFVERYALREDGVEQSFVFDQLPPGNGDLVVRGRVECELPATADAGGLRFDLAGVGHFRIGKVTGVAADGARAEGALRLTEGGIIELSLPEAFVRDAALPLTLDPLFGGVFAPRGISGDDYAPAIAYDLTTDRRSSPTPFGSVPALDSLCELRPRPRFRAPGRSPASARAMPPRTRQALPPPVATQPRNWLPRRSAL